MAGQINRMIDKIITAKSNGNPLIASATKTKLILKGVNPDHYNPTSPDDPQVIAKLRTMVTELGIRI